jgi:hypothetical protein
VLYAIRWGSLGGPLLAACISPRSVRKDVRFLSKDDNNRIPLSRTAWAVVELWWTCLPQAKLLPIREECPTTGNGMAVGACAAL